MTSDSQLLYLHEYESDGPTDLLEMVDRALEIGMSDKDCSESDLNDPNESELAEDFKFFVSSQNDDKPRKEGTIKNCRHMYRKLRAAIAIVERKRAELEANSAHLANEQAKFQAQVANWQESVRIAETKDWKKKYRALKEKYEQQKREMSDRKSVFASPAPSIASVQRNPSPVAVPPKQENRPPSTGHVRPKKTPVKKHKKAGPKLSPRLMPETPIKEPAAAKPKTPIVAPKLRRPNQLSDKYLLDFKFNPGVPIYEETRTDGRRIVRYRNGVVGTEFGNGTKKMKAGEATYVFYDNGDIAIDFVDGAHAYRYSETQTIELQIPDGTTIIQFSDGQREKHFANGDKEIQYPDGKIKTVHPDGDFELHLENGRIEKRSGGQ